MRELIKFIGFLNIFTIVAFGFNSSTQVGSNYSIAVGFNGQNNINNIKEIKN